MLTNIFIVFSVIVSYITISRLFFLIRRPMESKRKGYRESDLALASGFWWFWGIIHLGVALGNFMHKLCSTISIKVEAEPEQRELKEK